MSANTSARILGVAMVAVGFLFWGTWLLITGSIQIEIPESVISWLDVNFVPGFGIFLVLIGLVILALTLVFDTKK